MTTTVCCHDDERTATDSCQPNISVTSFPVALYVSHHSRHPLHSRCHFPDIETSRRHLLSTRAAVMKTGIDYCVPMIGPSQSRAHLFCTVSTLRPLPHHCSVPSVGNRLHPTVPYSAGHSVVAVPVHPSTDGALQRGDSARHVSLRCERAKANF